MFKPKRIYYEEKSLETEIGKRIISKFPDTERIRIENHNKIEELRQRPNSEFVALKKYLIIGKRKSLVHTSNSNSADFLVPFTSSGCTAMCLYCYLVCVYFNGAYLRIFTNRDEMINKIKTKASKSLEDIRFELGSNSDLILENTITDNLNEVIEEFGKMERAYATFTTKFKDVDSILNLKHNGHTEIRFSLNPKKFVREIEIGTASLQERMGAANKMSHAGYHVGINIAPIILHENWEEQYLELFEEMKDTLCEKIQKTGFFELIFLTYGITNHAINTEAMPNTVDVFNREIMRARGRGKYCYKNAIKEQAKIFFEENLRAVFPHMNIKYIV